MLGSIDSCVRWDGQSRSIIIGLAILAGLLVTSAWAEATDSPDKSPDLRNQVPGTIRGAPPGQTPKQKSVKERPRSQMSLAEIQDREKLPRASRPRAARLAGEALTVYESAKELIENGQFDQAKAKLARALELEPNSYDIHQALAKLAIGQGRLAQALEHIATAGQIDPDHIEIHILQGRIAAGRLQDERAIQSYALGLLCSDATKENVQTAEALLELSELLIKQGYLRAAIETYQRLATVLSETDQQILGRTKLQRLAKSPARIWVSIGRVHRQLNEAEQATRAFRQALGLAADKDFEVKALCARGLAEIGEYDQALVIIEELAADYSVRPLAGRLLVWIRDRQGQGQRAEEDLHRWQQRYPDDSGIAILLGWYYRKVSEPDKAREILIQAIRKNRRYLAAYRALSSLEAEQGRRVEAVKWLAKMVQAPEPAIGDARWRLIDIAGTKEEAAELFKQLRREKGLAREFSLAWAVGTVAEVAQKADQAALYYRWAINLQPRLGQLYVYLIKLLLRQGRTDQALAVIAEAERAKAIGVRLYQLEGLAYLLKDDLELAIVSLGAAVGVEPNDAAARQVLASVLLAAGRPDEAAKHLQTLLAEDSTQESVYRELMGAYLADGRAERAVAVAQKLMASHRSRPATALGAAQAFVAANKPEQAEKILEKLSLGREHEGLRQVLLIEAIVSQGKQIQARKKLTVWLEAIHSLEPRATFAARMAGLLAQIGEKAMAIELASTELQRNPGHPLLREMLIQVLLEIKDYEQAEKLIDQWLDEKGDRSVRRLRASLLLAKKNYDHAQQELKKLIREYPEDVQSLHLLGAVYELMGRTEQANEQYETILKIEPANLWANNNLGYSLALGNERLDDAQEMVRLALREGTAAPAIVDSMGWVLYKRGRFGQAVVYLSRAVRLTDEGQPELLDHLGDAYYRLQEQSRAVQAWKAALQAEQSNKQGDAEMVKRLQKKLNMVESKQRPAVSWSVVDQAKQKKSPASPAARQDGK